MSITAKKVSDIMEPNPVTIDATMSLRQAVEVLQDAGIGGAPVVSGSRLVGVVSSTDILEFEASSPGIPPERSETLEWGDVGAAADEAEPEDLAVFFFDRWADSESDVWSRIAETDGPEWDRLEEHTVGEVMSRKLVTVSRDASLPEAARVMLRHRVHRVLVVEGEDLAGLMSSFDFVELLAESDA